jgi:hypothetical protein
MLDTETAIGHLQPMPASDRRTDRKGCLVHELFKAGAAPEDCEEEHYANNFCKFHDELTDHGRT